MAEVTSQIFESFTHLPTSIERPIAVAGVAAAVLAAHYATRAVHGRTQEAYSVDFPNPALLEASITPNSRQNTRARLGSISLLLAGAGLVAAQYIGHPQFEVSQSDANTKLVVIEDISNSMLLTQDMDSKGTTRINVVATSIKESAFPGSLGVIQAAAAEKVVMPITKNWNRQLPDLSKPIVDPNGGALIPALDLAASLLPNKANNSGRTGNILLISDGTVTDSSTDLKAKVDKLKNQGIHLKVVLPGTKEGSYMLPGTSTKVSSSPQPERFNGLADSDVTVARTAVDVKKALQVVLRSSGESQHRQSNILLGTIGWALIGFANIRNIKQRLTKVV